MQQKLSQTVRHLLTDDQMRHGTLGISVVNSATGETVFEWNAQTGLTPASCQKTITAAAALELLQPAYRYKTVLGYDGERSGHTVKGNLYIIGSGDPTLGSWRYASANEDTVLNQWMHVLKDNGIEHITGAVIGHAGKWEKETLPGGWAWDDIGNYYGAGTCGLNWHENQYDLLLQPGQQVGDKANIINTKPVLNHVQLESELRTAARGSGDNASIYLPPFSTHGFVRGTIPLGEPVFKVSGSFPDPVMQFLYTVSNKMDTAGITHASYISAEDSTMPKGLHVLHTQLSPSLDSIIYWFMRKSVNLYGESLVKTIAYEKNGFGAARDGLKLIRQFWKEQGIDPSALHIVDGSGLSPQNRVTTDALVKVLQYAKSRPWFNYYYDALPVYNQMKLKSGTVGGVKSFAGYHTSKDGTAYTVAIIVNNFDGSANDIVRKMFVILDELK